MAMNSDHDWQLTKKTVLERNAYMFNNPLMSDIKFTCGESKRKYFYAHKYVLAISSPVFYAMFYGGLAEQNSVIHLPDTDEETFAEFIRFLYTDQCNLKPNIALKVMYLAKKYTVSSLAEKCSEVMQSSVNTENVLSVLEQAVYFDERELEEKCWYVVETQTSDTVTSEAFNNITQKTLVSLLKRDALSVPEVNLFQAVLKWCDNQCLKNGLETNAKNRRSVVGDAVYQIRFLSMTQREFAEFVSLSGLLMAEEMISIYGKLNGIDSPAFKFGLPSRNRNCLKRIARCSTTDVLHPSCLRSLWPYSRGDSDRLLFTVNKSVVFHGVRLFGDDKGSEYKVSLKVNGVKVSETYTSKRDSEGICGYDVMLSNPISIEENQAVTMTATIHGPTSFYMEKGRKSVEFDDVTLTFTNAIGPSNATNVSQGQFYQIILSF